jgi:hypothetical protein
LWNKRIDELKQRYRDKELHAEADANFFGVESRGMTQIRGNGLLFLTSHELVFGMFTPASEVVIPLTNITTIDTVKWHLGKSVFQPLLKVYFVNEEGVQDSVAWWVANPEDWKTLLEKRRQKKLS